MKKILSLLSLAALTVGLLGSCSKINERIDSLEKKVNGIESTSIASVQQQIDGIKASINDLKAADATINGKITELKTTAEAQQTLINALKEADQALGQKDAALEARIATLEGQVVTINSQIKTLEDADKAINVRIDELKSYIDTELGKAKDWATATFATLAQYQQTADDLAALSVTVGGINSTLAGVQTSIAALDTKIDGIDAALQEKITIAKTELGDKISDLKTELEGKIAEAISTSETGLQSWVNEQLSAYYTAAQMDAKITGLQSEINALKTDTDANKSKIEELETELDQLTQALEDAKTTIKTEYEAAIATAINDYNGTITQTIQTKIDEVNATITALTGRVETLETTVGILSGRIDAVEASIATIEQQIAAINQSISDLETIRTNIQELMEAKEAMGEDISELQAKDQALEGKITDLKNYVDTELANYATTEWANATFATLAKQEEIIADVAKLKQDLEGLDTKLDKAVADIKANLDKAIADLETSLKEWVNEQLTGYYTTAQIDAKIDELQSAIDALEGDNETNKSKIEEIEAELDKLTQDLAEAKTEIKAAYEQAIKDAIEDYNGTITEIIQSKIDEVNSTLNDLTVRVETLEFSVLQLTDRVEDLEEMIQTVSIIPAYNDGSVKVENDSLTITCVITPKEAVNNLEKEDFTILASEVLTKSALYQELTIASDTDLVLDETNGAATIKVDVSSVLPDDEGKALTVAVNIKNGISDYTTEFVPVYVASAPAPVIPEGALPGKFTVNAGGKKVYFSKGNLYADGDKALHFEANQYSSASSWDASHVSHFTWSSTVEAAVGSSNSGDYLFCDESHKVSVDGGEAIYYALSKDEWTYLFSNHSYKWASVNGVNGYVIAPDGFSGELSDTYSDDAALAANNLVFLPAAGNRSGSDVYLVGLCGDYWSSTANDGSSARGVMFASDAVRPDSSVDRNYGFSVRLITEGGSPAPSVVPVTGVTLDKTELSLMVGDSETLKATVQPADATNKNVIWSSDNTAVARVGSTDGKVTALAEGTATITAIVDGLFTATCTVTVKALPAGALKGEFSVSATKKVYFSQGNLTYNVSTETWAFYEHQYDCATGYDANLISLFTWGYGTWSTSPNGTDYQTGDFTDWGSQIGDGNTWRTLTTKEWQYLFNTRTMKNGGDRYTPNITYGGKKGVVLYPEDYSGSTLTSGTDYTDANFPANCVFLPAAGNRDGSNLSYVGVSGFYWSSTALDGDDAYSVYFRGDTFSPDDYAYSALGCSVRLITDASAAPAPTPTTTGTAKATIGGMDIDVNWVQLWAGGPKFAEYNVGASSATDIGSTMTFTDATKAGAEYVWGANWCTPSKDQMDELLKAATDAGSEKVTCVYTNENGKWGFKFTGKETDYTGNSVFFPARDGSSSDGLAVYWSATASGSEAWGMDLNYFSGNWYSNWYSYDQAVYYLVRPVLKN